MITSDKTSEFQSTRPMRGATLVSCEPCRNETFQSTRPMRGATHKWDDTAGQKEISIHAPHAGRDRRPRTIRLRFEYFNPRAPGGARPLIS